MNDGDIGTQGYYKIMRGVSHAVDNGWVPVLIPVITIDGEHQGLWFDAVCMTPKSEALVVMGISPLPANITAMAKVHDEIDQTEGTLALSCL